MIDKKTQVSIKDFNPQKEFDRQNTTVWVEKTEE